MHDDSLPLRAFLVDRQAAATVPPVSVLLERPRLAGGAAGDLAVHLSFHSSCVMCCCRHSRLQNAASPLQIVRPQQKQQVSTSGWLVHLGAMDGCM